VATRLLAAIDHRDAGQATVSYGADVARRNGSTVFVVHVLEYAGRGCASPVESRADAELIVERAVFELRMAGIGADGRVLPALRSRPSTLILRSAQQLHADAVLLGHNHLAGVDRMLGSGLRERVVRRSPVPVLVTPTTYVDDARTARIRRGFSERRLSDPRLHDR
jgi:nucleotide-binding universal stress UspA family protein